MKSRFNLRLLIFVLALLSISNVALVHADDEGSAEAVVDATRDVQVDEPESVDTPSDDVDDSATEAVTEEEEEPPVVEETTAVVDEVDSSISFITSAKSKATALVDKAKEITPAQMKKAAAGALGIWGVAAGAGWVMNQMGSED